MGGGGSKIFSSKMSLLTEPLSLHSSAQSIDLIILIVSKMICQALMQIKIQRAIPICLPFCVVSIGEISSDLYRHKKWLPKLNYFGPLIVVGDLR